MSLTEEVAFDNRGEMVRFPVLRRLFLALVIILVAGLSFGIGQLTGTKGRGPVKIEFDPTLSENQSASAIQAVLGPIVASKNGKKYHYLDCPGAKQIAEKNKLFFSSAEAAEASGYTLALNCSP